MAKTNEARYINTRGRQIRSGHLSYFHQVTLDLRELIGKDHSMET
jgi:hypothetical protein